MAKEVGNAPFKVRCHHCGQVIESVMLDCFNYDGSDGDVQHEFSRVGYNSSGDPFVEVTTNLEWTGEDLSGAEQVEAITCPKCGKHPFGCKSNCAVGSAVPPNLMRMLSIVMFPNKEDIECSDASKVDTSHSDFPMDTSAACNVQKMYEALKAAKQFLDGYTTNILELRRKVDAALSNPLRNCDRFTTVHEASKEFNYLWNFVWKIGGGIVDGESYRRRFQEWLFAPCETKGETEGR